MADKKDKTDPFELWRQWLDKSEHQINSMLSEFTSSKSFGKAQTRMMEALLKTQQGMNHAAQRYFTTINLPTRSDILELAGRVTQIEERLSSIEQVLLRLAGQPAAPATTRHRPPRTRKPPVNTTSAAEAKQSTGAAEATSPARSSKKTAAKKTTAKKSAKKKAAKKKAAKKKTARKVTKKKATKKVTDRTSAAGKTTKKSVRKKPARRQATKS